MENNKVGVENSNNNDVPPTYETATTSQTMVYEPQPVDAQVKCLLENTHVQARRINGRINGETLLKKT